MKYYEQCCNQSRDDASSIYVNGDKTESTTLHGNRFPSDALIQIIKQNGTRPIYFW